MKRIRSVLAMSMAVALTSAGLALQAAGPAAADEETDCAEAVVGQFIPGTVNDDVLVGTPYNDLIVAGDGNDIVFGMGGDDTTVGGPGADTISGGTGDDVILGGDGEAFAGHGGRPGPRPQREGILMIHWPGRRSMLMVDDVAAILTTVRRALPVAVPGPTGGPVPGR